VLRGRPGGLLRDLCELARLEALLHEPGAGGRDLEIRETPQMLVFATQRRNGTHVYPRLDVADPAVERVVWHDADEPVPVHEFRAIRDLMRTDERRTLRLVRHYVVDERAPALQPSFD
jgi:hypothetical protein